MGSGMTRKTASQTPHLTGIPDEPSGIDEIDQGIASARDTQPAWLAPLIARLSASASRSRERMSQTLRSAAVLVLLIDGPGGPRLLLTERSAALSHYPSLLAFPGGAVEPGDDSPAATALREAAEEIGLRSDTIDIVMELPVLALPATGFSVTPVLAWCADLQLTGVTNPDEVVSILQVSLHELEERGGRTHRTDAPAGSTAAWQVDGRPVGPMTAAIIELLVDRR